MKKIEDYLICFNWDRKEMDFDENRNKHVSGNWNYGTFLRKFVELAFFASDDEWSYINNIENDPRTWLHERNNYWHLPAQYSHQATGVLGRTGARSIFTFTGGITFLRKCAFAK